MIERLASPTAHELDALTDLWERSVRATHDFLAPEDIPFFRRMVRQEALPAAEIYVIRDSGNGFAAFAGIGADRLEMLFVAPGMRGKGFGRQLVNHITRHCGVRRVDVNEQNPQAAGFYERMGFRTAGRDATDPSGRPYPILHMELGHAPHTGLVPIPSLLIDRIDIDFRAEVPGTDTEKQP